MFVCFVLNKLFVVELVKVSTCLAGIVHSGVL